MPTFHPDLRLTARLIPRYSFNPFLRKLTNKLSQFRGVPTPPTVEGVTIRDVTVAVGQNIESIRVRLYSPQRRTDAVPAILWCHGGGFIIGTSELVERNSIYLAREVGILVAAVDYRLAPEHPFPVPLNDCYAALKWLHTEAASLGVLPDRIAVGGESAGGGLAAALTLLAHDHKSVPVAFQLLIYPMLDDRTTTRRDIDTSMLRIWSFKSNVYGWTSYLGHDPGIDGVSTYAAPARREDLTGLPPAWIGIGTLDLFHDEDVLYSKRLRDAGVPCQMDVVEGAYHLFDIVSPNAAVVKGFRKSYLDALRKTLFPEAG